MQGAKILILEDDWIVANGLREMLHAGGANVVGIATRPDQVPPLVLVQAPELALVDIHLGRAADGVEVARTTLTPAGVRVIFTSAHSDEATLARAREAGACGFVVKPYSWQQLRAAVEVARVAPSASAMTEHLVRAQRALEKLAQAMGGREPRRADVGFHLRRDPRLSALSERERDVLQGLLEHRRVPAIAEHLSLSAHTVRNHLKSIFAKLRVSTQQELLDTIIDRSTEAEKPPAASPRRRSQTASPPPSSRRLPRSHR